MTMLPTNLIFRPGLWQALALAGALIATVLPAIAETTVRASVDRQQLSADETLTLSLTADSMLFSDEPDVSALENDFHILNRQQSSRTHIINGKANSSRQWDYTLAPKREGTLTIPALPMGKYQTRPITVTVTDAPARSATGSEQVYLESDITPRRAYVQSQLEYTVRVFTSVNFLDASLESPELEDAVVESLGENRYSKEINGRYYQVIERRYAIFPQTSGELIVPALTLQARVESYRQSLLDPGRLVVKRSPRHRVKVMAPPNSFDGPVWLPAKSLSIEENWSRDLGEVRVGDSITRRLEINAEGLLGSQLPDLPETQLDGAKLYPDQPSIDKNTVDSGVLGRRVESTAIIPTQPGDYQLPEIRIPWWNTETSKQEVATLPARRITVLPALSDHTATDASTPATQTGNDELTSITAAPQWLWAILALLVISNIVTLVLLWRRRHSSAGPTQSGTTSTDSDSEKACYQALKKACRDKQSSPAQLRSSLLNWASTYVGRPCSLHQLGVELPALARFCQQLDQQLFSQAHSDPVDKRALLEAIDRVRAEKNSREKSPNTALPPLYS
ncbi:protein BatD [Spongiibacter nanhainus]|uniref:Protein BatD n=1 Tax=Spongiibacter nanhainus TaxID=2794344 RepID=A0A7T4UP93_9GAMM|nr:BatD family protein [Spongiibacter nanhainus]QQD17391.1 protein BatD [Spongiibacter nanhainus]